ncbi:MAG: PEP-CTERM sorting domain-containing protein [Proteobacteria bacterium]|uniref:PEP-CTERM sorting domain-containing protein n=1 Tax=Thauera sp. 2A1 TaxID=2570191 RepID=UPI0012910DE9|nr:PEP-CTERM sorting domain-containing protein [Thauera sp. 2A1]KAI5916021.1 PEP-CTERM sorting domain-containing protein [Thauera sp. 2A1]MBS0356252.1 PEP-CTERM sorting domain-containing protein [Pseudomonadota bacterium]
MNKKILASALAAGLISISTGANAGLLTFDTLPGDAPGVAFSDYGGLLWSNFFALNPDNSTDYNGSGYSTGRVSTPNVAFNGNGAPASVRTSDGSNFLFNGGYFSAAWHTGLEVTLEGLIDGAVTKSTKIVVGIPSIGNASRFDFDWTIDELRITSTGGVQASTDLAGDGTHFVLDNFTFNEQRTSVPEPGALALLGIGLAGLGLTRRRRAAA